VLVEGHDLLLRKLVHPHEERPLDDLGLFVAGLAVAVVTLKVDVDGVDDGVARDELLDFETGGKVGGLVDGTHGGGLVGVQALAELAVALVAARDQIFGQKLLK